ncbi:MAG TPA: hypothetical protein ACQGQH_05455 [Xylella sp.]
MTALRLGIFFPLPKITVFLGVECPAHLPSGVTVEETSTSSSAMQHSSLITRASTVWIAGFKMWENSVPL